MGGEDPGLAVRAALVVRAEGSPAVLLAQGPDEHPEGIVTPGVALVPLDDELVTGARGDGEADPRADRSVGDRVAGSGHDSIEDDRLAAVRAEADEAVGDGVEAEALAARLRLRALPQLRDRDLDADLALAPIAIIEDMDFLDDHLEPTELTVVADDRIARADRGGWPEGRRE